MRRLALLFVVVLALTSTACWGVAHAGGSGGSSSSSSTGTGGAAGPCPGGASSFEPAANRITIAADLSSCVTAASNTAAAACVQAIAAGLLTSFAPLASAPTCRLDPSAWYPYTDHGAPTFRYDGESVGQPVLLQDFARVPSFTFVALGVQGLSSSQILDQEMSAYGALRSGVPYPLDERQHLLVSLSGAAGPVMLSTYGTNTAVGTP